MNWNNFFNKVMKINSLHQQQKIQKMKAAIQKESQGIFVKYLIKFKGNPKNLGHFASSCFGFLYLPCFEYIS